MVPTGANKNALFAWLWLSLVGISVHDGYWCWLNRNELWRFELNPQGRLLLDAAGGHVWLLLTVKLLGTVLAASALLILYWHRPRLGWLACAGVALFQALLLAFLYLA